MTITIKISDEDGFVSIADDFETRTPWDDPVRPLSAAEEIAVKMIDHAVNDLEAIPVLKFF